MKKSVGILMDSISKLNLESDSTLRLAWEAVRRNYILYYFRPEDLFFQENECFALAQIFKPVPDDFNIIEFGEKKKLSLKSLDIIFVRHDPPFDITYITATYLLEKIANKVLIVNNPTEIRNCPEKLFLNKFPEITPPTVISSNQTIITEFLEECEEIVLKPIYAHGGKDVFYLHKNDPNFKAIFDHLLDRYKTHIIAQKYISDVTKGDKRIMLLDGKPIASLLRVPNSNEIRANLAQGGKAEIADLTKRDLEICNIIGGELKKRGLIFVGIDVIGDYLTEINVTSPTGIASFNALHNTRIEEQIWDKVEDIFKSINLL